MARPIPGNFWFGTPQEHRTLPLPMLPIGKPQRHHAQLLSSSCNNREFHRIQRRLEHTQGRPTDQGYDEFCCIENGGTMGLHRAAVPCSMMTSAPAGQAFAARKVGCNCQSHFTPLILIRATDDRG